MTGPASTRRRSLEALFAAKRAVTRATQDQGK
jgi:hypothetical protein